MTFTQFKGRYIPNTNDGFKVEFVPRTFNEDKLNKKKVASLDVFFQLIANEIREEQELTQLNY